VHFRPRAVDAVVMLEVLEHLPKSGGLALLDRAESWARKRVILSTPNGFVPQAPLEGNPYQAHRSGWEVEELRHRGYRAYGLAGLKWLRQENDHDVIQREHEAILASIKLRPRTLWLGVSAASQLVTYRLPKWSFGVMYVLEVDHG
jgi:hypothetical protein